MNKLKMTINQIDNDTITTSNCTSEHDHYYVIGDVKTSPITFDAYIYEFYEGEWVKQFYDDWPAYLCGFDTAPNAGDMFEEILSSLRLCKKSHDHFKNARED